MYSEFAALNAYYEHVLLLRLIQKECAKIITRLFISKVFWLAELVVI